MSTSSSTPQLELGSHPKYRPDIDGLRAIAVLSVIAFHAFPSFLPGGFIGVDVFFVISGFLISTIILKNLDRGTFSFKDFYSRRIRRIFPALSIVLFSSLVIGWFTLFPREYRQLGSHAAASAAFIQNFVLWLGADYFDNLSELKPLLHIWSLGIEEQFYFIWPLALYFSSRYAKKPQKATLIFMLLTFFISLILSEVEVLKDPTTAFYLPHYRFWELSVGGILAWYTLYKPGPIMKYRLSDELKKLSQNGLAFISFIGLIFAFFKYSSHTVFPGLTALVPVIASAAIIHCNKASIINSKILSNKILVFIGLISFPLYLWHWLFLSFARVLYGQPTTSLTRIILVGLSFVFSYVTYRFIETPIRKQDKPKTTWILFSLIVLVVIAGKHVRDHAGMHNRGIVTNNTPHEAPSDDSPDELNSPNHLVPGCGLSEKNQDLTLEDGCLHDGREAPTIALIGDSKAQAFVQGLARHTDEKSRILFIGGTSKNGSPNPYQDSKQNYLPNPLGTLAINAVLQTPTIKTVILTFATRLIFDLKTDEHILDLHKSTKFNLALQRTEDFIKPLIDHKIRIVLTVDNPTLPDPLNCIPRITGLSILDDWIKTGRQSRNCSITYDEHLELSKLYRQFLSEVEARHPGLITVFDTLPYLCDMTQKICPMRLNGHTMYSYTDHISDYAASRIGKALLLQIK